MVHQSMVVTVLQSTTIMVHQSTTIMVLQSITIMVLQSISLTAPVKKNLNPNLNLNQSLNLAGAFQVQAQVPMKKKAHTIAMDQTLITTAVVITMLMGAIIDPGITTHSLTALISSK